MDVIRKITENQSIFLSQDMLNHLGIQKGSHVVVRADRGKWGNFISIFVAKQPDHKRLVRLKKQQEGGVGDGERDDNKLLGSGH